MKNFLFLQKLGDWVINVSISSSSNSLYLLELEKLTFLRYKNIEWNQQWFCAYFDIRRLKTIKLSWLSNLIDVLFCFSNTMKTILFVITVCLLVHICTGCSVWNRDRPCRCLCEDTNTYCKKACYNMCFGKICTATEKIEQSRCYSQCEQTFTICFNGCSSRIWPSFFFDATDFNKVK